MCKEFPKSQEYGRGFPGINFHIMCQISLFLLFFVYLRNKTMQNNDSSLTLFPRHNYLTATHTLYMSKSRELSSDLYLKRQEYSAVLTEKTMSPTSYYYLKEGFCKLIPRNSHSAEPVYISIFEIFISMYLYLLKDTLTLKDTLSLIG